MAVVSMNLLLESGVHFGHQTKRWNPKMKEYIFTSRDDIYIIDLQKTAKKIEEAYAALHEIAKNGGKVIFVGVTLDAGSIEDGKFTLVDTRKEMTGYKEEMAKLTGSDFITCEQKIADFYTSEVARLGSVSNVIGYYFRDSRYMTGQFDTDEIKYSYDGITEENVYISGNFEKKDVGYAIDTTHTNLRGADVVAQKFYEAIVESDSILKAYTK